MSTVMTPLMAAVPPPAAPPPAGPVPKLWTVAEFHRLGEAGTFKGLRASLIDGVVVEEGMMGPQHAYALELLDAAIRLAFGAGWRFRVQMPLPVGRATDPLPDFVVAPPVARDAGGLVHPPIAVLVVEVSDSSLRYDLTDKMSLYAAAGVPEYWVLDIDGRRLIVHRDPRPDAAQRFGHGYGTVTEHGPADRVGPGGGVAVGELLP